MKHLLLVIFFSATVLAGQSHDAGDRAAAATGRPVEQPSGKSRITGCVGKNNSGEFLNFGMKIGNDWSNYTINGSTAPNQGIYRTDSDYSGVEVRKHSVENGLTYIDLLTNSGTVQIYPRKRIMEGVQLAGVGVSGYYTQKLFTDSLVMKDLNVGGKSSAGKLFYNQLTGTYKCTSGNCRFGEYEIGSTMPGSNIALNYDHFINHRMRVSMKFGDLALTGLIKFTDTTQSSTDSDGNTTTTVTATQACFNVDVKKSDGSNPVLASHGQPETQDDKTTKSFIAWLELMSHDIFAE